MDAVTRREAMRAAAGAVGVALLPGAGSASSGPVTMRVTSEDCYVFTEVVPERRGRNAYFYCVFWSLQRPGDIARLYGEKEIWLVVKYDRDTGISTLQQFDFTDYTRLFPI